MVALASKIKFSLIEIHIYVYRKILASLDKELNPPLVRGGTELPYFCLSAFLLFYFIETRGGGGSVDRRCFYLNLYYYFKLWFMKNKEFLSFLIVRPFFFILFISFFSNHKATDEQNTLDTGLAVTLLGWNALFLWLNNASRF